MQRSSKILSLVLLSLAIAVGLIWYALLQESRSVLTVSFLDVGQGDAVFIETPSGRQVLIDGGKGNAVIRELSHVMPWYDRSIDLVIATHPDQDHIGGLIEVLARYSVPLVMKSSVLDEKGSDYIAFEKFVASEGAPVIEATRGQIIDLGSGARLEILFPDREVPNVETNTGAIVARLVYGETSFMLTSDSPSAIEMYLVALGTTTLKSSVLKAGHHGSKTSSAPVFVGFVDPEFAIYSRGCDNSYGHPNAETVATFARFNIPTLDTCEEGTITFVSDGQTIVRK